jgi:hypothetical protein
MWRARVAIDSDVSSSFPVDQWPFRRRKYRLGWRLIYLRIPGYADHDSVLMAIPVPG